MAFSRKEFAENISRLKDHGGWRHYVHTLEIEYNTQVTALLLSDHPDEALRGECRALLNQLKRIKDNSGSTTL
jgi:hypothetical protein